MKNIKFCHFTNICFNLYCWFIFTTLERREIIQKSDHNIIFLQLKKYFKLTRNSYCVAVYIKKNNLPDHLSDHQSLNQNINIVKKKKEITESKLFK